MNLSRKIPYDNKAFNMWVFGCQMWASIKNVQNELMLKC